MFNLIVSGISNSLETDGLMRLPADRFTKGSGAEGQGVSSQNPQSLALLTNTPTLLMYERGMEGPHTTEVRYGHVSQVQMSQGEVVFRFTEIGRLPLSELTENAMHVGMLGWEFTHTHWAIKDGNIPVSILRRVKKTYDVVLSFAGEDRGYVEAVASILIAEGIRVFYDVQEQVDLWGHNLAERLPEIYSRQGLYCIMFISRHYAEKMWTRVERQAALDRAMRERGPYILPCRFDATELPGLSPSTSYMPLQGVVPATLAARIIQKIRHS
jgi:hypothetical protein